MLKIIKHIKDLDISQILRVYAESIQQTGAREYPRMPANMQLLSAEQDLCDYLRLFLKDENSYCAVWPHQGEYVATLRLERYADGFIITSLETALWARRNGYAKQLVNSVLDWLSKQGIKKVYSHIEKKNEASLSLHLSCGFQRILEYAVYVDGSILQSSCTMCYEFQ